LLGHGHDARFDGRHPKMPAQVSIRRDVYGGHARAAQVEGHAVRLLVVQRPSDAFT
jgi:hypothetical protein